jgi:hypothetical protein
MKPKIGWNALRKACAVVCLAGSFAFASPSLAAEYGWGTYLLGLSIPMIGFTPPPGFYLSDSVYAYQGSASGSVKFPFGHANLAVQVKEDFLINISTLTWVTDTKILGGNLGFAATVPFPIGTERTSAGAAFTGPWETRSPAASPNRPRASGTWQWLACSGGTRAIVTGT